MDATLTAWGLFHVLLLGMLALDLGVFHRRSHAVSVREALTWSAVWISLALLFNVGIYATQGTEPALQFLAGYVIEKSLSVDNVFVFAMIFGYFRVPAAYQHKVLFWGILGALLMRAGFIFAGVALVKQFHSLMYVFGALLIFSGIKMLMAKDAPFDPDANWIMRLARRMLRVAPQYDADRFFTRMNSRWAVTPLFLVLLFVELTDVVLPSTASLQSWPSPWIRSSSTHPTHWPCSACDRSTLPWQDCCPSSFTCITDCRPFWCSSAQRCCSRISSKSRSPLR